MQELTTHLCLRLLQETKNRQTDQQTNKQTRNPSKIDKNRRIKRESNTNIYYVRLRSKSLACHKLPNPHRTSRSSTFTSILQARH